MVAQHIQQQSVYVGGGTVGNRNDFQDCFNILLIASRIALDCNKFLSKVRGGQLSDVATKISKVCAFDPSTCSWKKIAQTF